MIQNLGNLNLASKGKSSYNINNSVGTLSLGDDLRRLGSEMLEPLMSSSFWVSVGNVILGDEVECELEAKRLSHSRQNLYISPTNALRITFVN